MSPTINSSSSINETQIIPQIFVKSDKLKIAEKVAIGVIVTGAVLGVAAAVAGTVALVIFVPPASSLVVVVMMGLFLSLMTGMIGGAIGGGIGALAWIPVEERTMKERQKFARNGNSNFEVL